MADTGLHRTALFDRHEQAGAQLTEFAGWEMPLRYGSELAEHHAVRQRAGLFDLGHMGQIEVAGPRAGRALDRALMGGISTIAVGRARYTMILDKRGGILDDLIVYRLEENRFLLVVNAARIDTDREWIRGLLPPSAVLEDVSPQTAKIDLQGPLSLEVLLGLISDDWKDLGYFSFCRPRFRGEDILVSRTGYTGELGYEIYLPTWTALEFWEACLQDDRVRPAGLGARDTLRLEMGLPLYGQDLDEHHTPAEAGYAGLLTSPAPYVGKDRQMDVLERLIPLLIPGRRSARHADVVYGMSGDALGRVTSGSFAPSLGQAVALAYVDARFADEPEFVIRTGKAELPARRTALPFYTQGTARMKF